VSTPIKKDSDFARFVPRFTVPPPAEFVASIEYNETPARGPFVPRASGRRGDNYDPSGQFPKGGKK
jgi:hypothetical protein